MSSLELLKQEAKAYREEQLAALFFIAAAVAFNAGWNTFGWLMCAKAILDTICAIGVWGRVYKASARSSQKGKEQ